ncbi:hypothetical protein G6F63_016510 [Rhizopus arrhizus]|nr:hypothetical protein G6F24_015931 [Rhizopus arrhizus]KAG0753599.1 hypothetical protein G6F22_021384 [Rhizopus arrhizus]KAG0753672.1 hypothetical protein G6F22_021354 [Rhizopus arrhizus]KAG0772861.1 hypothetical protein G6F21_014416 [Rhizopus arrhizus]KAG1007648.1 hypothetical protein G6F25_014382 [Rhizopus arrhizus]
MLLSNFLHNDDFQYWYEVTKHQDLQDQKKNHVEDLYYDEQEMLLSIYYKQEYRKQSRTEQHELGQER